tara:strand:+ start:91 stop:516 length:426 start_codon:yes stop_codon:yes gene_type:complete
MATYTSTQLQGAGTLITDAIDSSTTFKVTKTGGDQIVYLTFDIDGGSSTAVSGLNSTTFTSKDTNGNNIYPAFSTTNFAYCLNRGTYDSGEVTFAANMPTIAANTLRARIVGFGASGDTFLTVGGGGVIPLTIPFTIASAP